MSCGRIAGSLFLLLLLLSADVCQYSEPFDVTKSTKPTVTICDTHKVNDIKYGQERRNARAAQKTAAAAAAAAAVADMALEE